jgi:SAM-dependent methyltransferase
MSRGHFIGLNHHRLMLADRLRMEAYQAAIEASVRPGMRVLDLGTGTGILAMWAARAGAEVVAVEPHDVIRVAERVARANGLAARITFIQGDARALTLPWPVDLVVSECMGNFFITDEMQPVLRDLPRHLACTSHQTFEREQGDVGDFGVRGPEATEACFEHVAGRRREHASKAPAYPPLAAGGGEKCRLAAGGRTLPARIRLRLAAATLPLWREQAFWREPVGGFDYSEAADFAAQASYVVACEPELVCTAQQTVDDFALVDAPDTLDLPFDLEVTRAVRLHALIGWFDAELTDAITLSTAPGERTHWGQMAFPLPETAVEPGDSVRGRVILAMDEAGRSHYTWAGRVVRPGRGDVVFSRDTRRRFEGGADEVRG